MPDGSVAKMTDDLSAAWNTDFFQEVRRKMLAGENVPACANCYKEEAVGHTSPRLFWNEKFSEFVPDPTDTIINLDQVEQLDLRLGKNCNLQCRMCGPYSSSTWAKPWKELGDLVTQPSEASWKNIAKNDWSENLEVWEKIKLFAPKLRRLYLTGGEPFMISQNKEFLRHCVETGHSSHIELRYNTNGTIWDPELPGLWSHFKCVRLKISIDGIDEVNNYIRYPSKWSLILKNLELAMKTRETAPVIITITTAVQAYNIFMISEFISFMQDRDLPVNIDYVHQPAYLSVGVLSPELSEKAKAKLQNLDHPARDGLIKSLNSSRHSEWDHFIKYTKQLDHMNGQNISAIIPELGL